MLSEDERKDTQNRADWERRRSANSPATRSAGEAGASPPPGYRPGTPNVRWGLQQVDGND